MSNTVITQGSFAVDFTISLFPSLLPPPLPFVLNFFRANYLTELKTKIVPPPPRKTHFLFSTSRISVSISHHKQHLNEVVTLIIYLCPPESKNVTMVERKNSHVTGRGQHQGGAAMCCIQREKDANFRSVNAKVNDI